MNTQQDTHAQKPTTPKLTPDFSHKLGLFDREATALNLADAVDTLALQAVGVLDLLGSQFLGDDDNKLTDEIIFWSIESAKASVKDIQAIVTAYHEANRKVPDPVATPKTDGHKKTD